ncbi:ornithine cyclodeaminase family protein [Phycicoccus sp. M110.8]|uniref:ornithine cyclodeaminase family protein n=1 Tax=Phycicoccus sp. M110.8 TaxID=3075433 RepID=UPI0028FD038D|nr:ornithine cyclodeaminase family protein [Phycicoccus sp. M110.8]MDU0313062.1 ornithine cyclodeaminase family protein [Phycicoccus sp. M110.8]
MTLLLTRDDILPLLVMAEVIDAVEQGHADLSAGRAVHPSRETVAVPGGQALLVPMVAASPVSAAVKVMTDTPANRAKGLPVQQSLIVVVDGERGHHEAILDGGAITRIRTAAASAVATRHLSLPGARTLGVVGAGGLALAHVRAIREVRPIERVLVWSRTRARAEGLARELRAEGVQVEVCAGEEQVVREADIVCTLTPSRDAHVRGAWFHPGQHVNVVGAPPRPDHREVDTEGIRRSRVVVDSRAVALEESGDVLIPIAEGAVSADHCSTELGEVVTGTAPGRRSPGDITLFDSVGLGLQDLVTARLVIDRARAEGVGTELVWA